MNIRPVTVILAVFSVVAIFFSFKLFRKNKLGYQSFLLWLLVWLLMGIFSLFPKPLDLLTGFLSMGERLVFLFVFSIVILFVFVLYLFVRVTEVTRKVTRLVQEIGILRYKLEKAENVEVKDKQTTSKTNEVDDEEN